MDHEAKKADEKKVIPIKAEEAPPAEKQVPVRAQIVITLFEGGDCQVDGPFGDRLLFIGMLGIAAEVERDKFRRVMEKRERAARAEAERLAKENPVKRMFRLAREKKEREAQENAARLRAEAERESARRSAEEQAAKAGGGVGGSGAEALPAPVPEAGGQGAAAEKAT